MRNLILILVALFITVSSVDAQQNNFSISLAGGVGQPIGEWGLETTQSEENIRYINPGSSLNLSVAYQIPQTKFGIIAMGRRQVNTVDTDKMEDAFNTNYSTDFVVESDDWIMNQVMLGAVRSLEFSDKLNFEVRAMTGLMNITRPLNTFYVGANYISQPTTISNTWTYLVGAGLDYQLTNNLSVIVHTDYTGGRPRFRFEETTNIDGYYSDLILTRNIHSINLNAGITVKF